MKKVEKQNIPILSPRYGISCSHHPRRLSRASCYRRLISLFFAPHPVRIFRRTQIDAPRRGRRPRRPASAHRRVPAYSRLSLRRGRRPRRPVARSFHASGRDISRSGATSFCPRRQKDAKTPPKTHGLWNSFAPNVIRRKKAHKESLPLLSPLPLPRTARVACYDRLRYSAIRAAAAPVPHAETRRSVIVQWDCCVHIGGFPNTGAPR